MVALGSGLALELLEVVEVGIHLRLSLKMLTGDYYYEIVKLSEDRKLFGQVAHGFEISAICKRARQGLFDAT